MAKQTSKKLDWKKVAAVTTGAVVIIAGSVNVARKTIDPHELVTEVIDGDTFTISNNQNIRLFGVDAPEIQYCFGKEAKDALSKKILGKKIILQEPRTDKFGRILALIYIDGELVNEYMIKNGFALSRGQGESEGEKMKEANDFARANGVGIFSDKCYQINPPNESCNIKGNVSNVGTGKAYLLPNCTNYTNTVVEKFQGEDWFCSEKEARDAGFVQSANCH
jgi:endonuclease YncB( thermonuclease family)